MAYFIYEHLVRSLELETTGDQQPWKNINARQIEKADSIVFAKYNTHL
jgi:hypothetical protein